MEAGEKEGGAKATSIGNILNYEEQSDEIAKAS